MHPHAVTVRADSPTRPNPALRRQRESWRGAGLTAAALAGLALCVCAAAGASLAGTFPSALDRYLSLTPGQASVYRITYADGNQGFASINVERPSSTSLSYAALAGEGGQAVQLRTHYTNWLGTGETYDRLDHYARQGGRMILVANEDLAGQYEYAPPALAWGPEILTATASDPYRAATEIDGQPAAYVAWRAPDESIPLPDGKAHPALRIEVQWLLGGELYSRDTGWYAPGIGLVRQEGYDAEGALYQRLELVSSTRLPDAAQALPLPELLTLAGGAEAIFREDSRRTGAHPLVDLDAAALDVVYQLDAEAPFTASPVQAGGVMYLADQSGRLAAIEAYQAMPRWQFTAGGPIVAAPVVAGGVIYFGAADKSLYALDAGQGLFLWRYTLRDNIATSPAVSEGVVYFGGEDRTVYALDATTGALRWKYGSGDRLVSSPTVAGGRVFIGGGDGIVYALEADSGALLWRAALDAGIEASPAIGPDGTVYAASTGSQMAAFDPATGERRWVTEKLFGFVASPAVGNGQVFNAGRGGAVWAFDAATGATLWEWVSPAGDTFVASPLLVGGVLLAADTGGRAYALDAETGTVLAEYDLGAPVTASPTWTGEAVLFATQGGSAIALGAATEGSSAAWDEAWQAQIEANSSDPNDLSIFANPIQAGESVYVLPRGGRLWALDPATGAARMRLDTGGAALGTPAQFEGVLYLGTEAGTLLAFDPDAAEVLWETELGGLVRFGPVVDEAGVFVQTLSEEASVFALDRTTGELLWERGFGDGNSTPLLYRDTVIVSGEAIVALDRRTGAEVWRSPDFAAVGSLALAGDKVYGGGAGAEGVNFMALDAGSGIVLWQRVGAERFGFGRPGVDAASNTVIAGTMGGQVVGMVLTDGGERWQFQANGSVETDIVVQEGRAYFTARTGTLYILDAATGRLLRSFRPGEALDTFAAPLVVGDRVYALHGTNLYALSRR